MVAITLENWWRSTKIPGEVRPYPWIHPAAVAYLESLLTPDMVVLEQGSGGSTLWYNIFVTENGAFYLPTKARTSASVRICDKNQAKLGCGSLFQL